MSVRSAPATGIGAKRDEETVPEIRRGGGLEAFLETADLDEYDLAAGALPRDEWFARYELFAKDASIHLRLPGRLLDAVRARAMKEGIPAQRLIREYIERGLRRPSEPERPPRAKRR